MNGISTSIAVLLMKGIPEGFMATLALHLFTRTKVQPKKYFMLSLIYIVATYLIRLLPITLGVNTVLSLFVLILCFQFAYKYQLSKVISSIVSAFIIMIIIAVSEIINMIMLTMMYGEAKAEELFNSSVGIEYSLSGLPSTIFIAVFILIGYFIIKNIEKRKQKSGKANKKTGE